MQTMRTRTTNLPVLLVSLSVLFGLSGPAWAQDASSPLTEAVELWEQMRRMENVNSEEFAKAGNRLVQLISSLPPEQKTPVATALMRRGVDDAVNAAALEMFGMDGIPTADIKAILDNENRTFQQRVLVRTYYKFCRGEYETRLSEETRRELVGILADHLKDVYKRETLDYGEQRLLTHTLQAVLSRYFGKQGEVPEMVELLEAMLGYRAKNRVDDTLAASIAAWLEMKPSPQIDSTESALLAMGHWEPLVRLKAAVYLGGQIRKDDKVGDEVLKQLNDPPDPRDEVRASAARVFSFSLSYHPGKIIPAMVRLLVWDRGVIVQQAASETLIAHSDEAQITVDLLLESLQTRSPRPGPKRTTSILRTLSYLVHPNTPSSQKTRLLKVAVANLEFAPQGALRAMEALGPDALPAVGNITQYRDTKADRFTRQYINRHVLMVIDPKSVEKE